MTTQQRRPAPSTTGRPAPAPTTARAAAAPPAAPAIAAAPQNYTQLLTTADVALRLGVDVRTVRRYIVEDRTLPGYRVGRELRVSVEHLAAFVEQRAV